VGAALGALALTFAAGCESSVHVKASTEADAASDTQAGGPAQAGSSGKGIGEVTRSGPPTVTYPGFEVLPDGRSVLTVQVSGVVDVTEQKSEGRLVYFVKGAQVPYKVNRLPLVTTNFATQVSRVQLEQVDGGANVIVELREPATPTHTVGKIEGGTLLSVTFPKSERFGEFGIPKSPGDDKKAKRTADDDEAGQGDGRHHKRRQKKDEEEAKEEQEDKEEAAEEGKDGHHKKRHERQVVRMVERHITVGWHTLAPDFGLTVAGVGKNNPTVYLSSGIRIGIVEQFEVEATPHAFRLYQKGGYYLPSVGATWNFVQTRPFDMGVRARFFIPADTHVNTDPGAYLVGSLPIIIHLGSIAKIDTGGSVTALLTKPHGDLLTSSYGPTPFGIGASAGRVGLVDLTPSPFYAQPGVPLKFTFQPADAAFIGVGTGLSIYDFKKSSETMTIPLGFSAGVTTSTKDRPNADFGINFDWPYFVMPGNRADHVGENIYEIAAWLRWYYYL
jgi:hypothetical protein